MKLRCIAVCLVLAAPLLAQEEAAPAAVDEEAAPTEAEIEAIHDDLRALRDAVISAVNTRDTAAVLAHLHPDVVVTWQNAEVSRGHAGVQEYYERMMEGPAKIVEDFQMTVQPDELTILHGGDTGIAFGSSTESFSLTRGLEFEHHGRWSATLVREDGRWLISNFHASTNIFDNPLLRSARRSVMWGAAAALVVGLALGWWLASRRRRSAA